MTALMDSPGSMSNGCRSCNTAFLQLATLQKRFDGGSIVVVVVIVVIVEGICDVILIDDTFAIRSLDRTFEPLLHHGAQKVCYLDVFWDRRRPPAPAEATGRGVSAAD